jgi:hypothetical protein
MFRRTPPTILTPKDDPHPEAAGQPGGILVAGQRSADHATGQARLRYGVWRRTSAGY